MYPRPDEERLVEDSSSARSYWRGYRDGVQAAAALLVKQAAQLERLLDDEERNGT